MKTRKLIAAFFAIFAAGMSFAGTICTCTTSPVAVDTVTIDGDQIVDSLQVSYDAAWIGGGANATVVIADNGTEVKRTTGAGAFTHTLTGDGRHELTYTTYIGGVAQDEVYTATVYKNWTCNISDVAAKQRYPWNGKVDITYTLMGDVTAGFSPEAEIALSVTASNRVDGATYAADASALSGDTGTAEGAHHVVWDLNAQGIEFVSDDVVFTVAYVPVMRYCVVDLAAGATAASYPVTYVSSVTSEVFNTDEYKTTKLVLRLVEPGTFMMNGSYSTTLTKPFYCGVFEVTQKQWELVTGSNPSSYKGNMRPVEQVSWNTIRGDSSTYNWPGSANVDSNSFVGRLQARTGLNFDLPTEAQWEYACRAGTTSKYNNGGDTENDLKQLGRYWDNRSDGKGGYTDAHTKVGSYEPNAWGLYDMHGNVLEWCLDWYGSLSSGVTDPVGSSSGSYRVLRGGSWGYNADGCASSDRILDDPSSVYYCYGFRLVRTLSNTEGERSPEAVAGAERADALCAAEAAPVAIDSRVDAEPVLGSVVVAWDAAWIGGDTNATVVIADNGTEVKRATGAGAFTHTLTGGGRHEMTYTTYIDGVAQDEVYTATFLGLGPDAPVILPESGRVFEGSLTVTISCETEGAAIYYTTDGSEPTKDSTAYKRFKIYGKATVKAIAYDAARDRYSDVTTAEYALGSCANLVIAPAGGSAVATEGGYVFYHDGQTVTISRNGDEGTIRYTLDGTAPTASSAVYSGPITLDVTTTVKAKVFSDSYFDSDVVTVVFVREWEQVATPEITAASTFTGSRTTCEIACATEGARIFYTLNGNAPTSHSTRYTGAFYVTDSCTVKAIALLSGCLDSEVAVKTITKEWTIGDTMGAPDLAFTTSGDGDKAFYRVADATAPNGEAMHSGDIGNSSAYGTFARTVLSTTVTGPGTASFLWKASCEDDAPDYEWDHGEFAVDGVVRAYVSGETGWTNVSVEVTGPGEHTLTWTYLKDDAEAEGEDCIWVGGFGWESAEPYTHTTEVPVPYAWLRAHDPGVVDEYEAYEASAKATAANGRNKVWECYVAGISPTNETAKFTAAIEMVDGVPQITWSPNLNTNGIERTYTIWGKTSLTDGAAWECPTNSAHRFFKVTVEMP